MTYNVIEDFTDEEFLVLTPEGDAKEPLKLVSGTKFVPAAIHYPQDRVDARVAAGTISLLTPTTEKAHAKRTAKRK